MNAKICDRCGVSFPDREWTVHGAQTNERHYQIKKETYAFYSEKRTPIDLCDKCEDDFERWLKNDTKIDSEKDS